MARRVESRKRRIDCKKAELSSTYTNRCRWCGWPCKWTYSGKLQHRRGYRRIWDDLRKQPAVSTRP